MSRDLSNNISLLRYALFYVVLVNAPYLAIRIYLYIVIVQPQNISFDRSGNSTEQLVEIKNTNPNGQNYDLSIFVLKNVIMMYIALKEVRFSFTSHEKNQHKYTQVYARVQYYRQKRSNMHGGELIKNDEHQETREISAPTPPQHQA